MRYTILKEMIGGARARNGHAYPYARLLIQEDGGEKLEVVYHGADCRDLTVGDVIDGEIAKMRGQDSILVRCG